MVSAFGRLCGHTTQGRLHKSLKATRVATLLYVNFWFVVFGFPCASRLVFILHIYICSSRACEKNCHILIGCLVFCKLKTNPWTLLGYNYSHPASRAFLLLARFWCSRERLCMNRVRSLLSMRCMLPGYSFEPRPNLPNRGALASNFKYSISRRAFHKN